MLLQHYKLSARTQPLQCNAADLGTSSYFKSTSDKCVIGYSYSTCEIPSDYIEDYCETLGQEECSFWDGTCKNNTNGDCVPKTVEEIRADIITEDVCLETVNAGRNINGGSVFIIYAALHTLFNSIFSTG